MKKLMQVILSVIVLVTGKNIFNYKTDVSKKHQVYDKIQQEYVMEDPVGQTESSDNYKESSTQTLKAIDFTGLKKLNEEIKGWLYIPGTNIDYPIMQTIDNEYYLNHSSLKEYTRLGSIFMDYRNSDLFSDQNTIIYGHRMKNNTMFGELYKFKNKTFFDNHPIIYIFKPGDILVYRIWRVFICEADFDYRQINFESESLLNDYIIRVEEKIMNERDRMVDMEDQLLTLSTCEGEKRLVLVAIKE